MLVGGDKSTLLGFACRCGVFLGRGPSVTASERVRVLPSDGEHLPEGTSARDDYGREGADTAADLLGIWCGTDAIKQPSNSTGISGDHYHVRSHPARILPTH